jgi:hypothetical protein
VNLYYYHGSFDQYNLTHLKGLRVLPIQQTIEDTRQILPYEEVVKVMDGVDTICNCCRDRCISLLVYLGRDSKTKAIMMYVEGFREARHFLKVAREVTRREPVIILKGGRTEAGAKRAFTHTASLAVNDSVLDMAFRQAGIVRARRYSDLINAAKGIAFQPLL